MHLAQALIPDKLPENVNIDGCSNQAKLIEAHESVSHLPGSFTLHEMMETQIGRID